MRAFKSHQLISTSQSPSQSVSVEVYCLTHPKEILRHYCTTCSEIICSECGLYEHQGHSYSSLDDALVKEKTTLFNLVSTLKDAVPKVTDASEKVRQSIEALSSCKDAVKLEINNKFDNLSNPVETRRQRVLCQLDEVTLAKSNLLQVQSYQLLQLSNKMEHIVSIVGVTESYTASEFLVINNSLCSASMGLMKEVEETKLQPVIDIDVSYDWNGGITNTAVSKYGSFLKTTTFLVDINPALPIGVYLKKECYIILHATGRQGERKEYKKVISVHGCSPIRKEIR